MKKEFTVEIDSFGRTIVQDEKLLSAITGALQTQTVAVTDYNAACGDNAGCSNTSCNPEPV